MLKNNWFFFTMVHDSLRSWCHFFHPVITKTNHDLLAVRFMPGTSYFTSLEFDGYIGIVCILCDWLEYYYFGFGFTTLHWKPLIWSTCSSNLCYKLLHCKLKCIVMHIVMCVARKIVSGTKFTLNNLVQHRATTYMGVININNEFQLAKQLCVTS